MRHSSGDSRWSPVADRRASRDLKCDDLVPARRRLCPGDGVRIPRACGRPRRRRASRSPCRRLPAHARTPVSGRGRGRSEGVPVAPRARCLPQSVTIAGDSSRGGLALSVLLTLKQRGAPLPGAVVLLCPWLDLRLRHEVRDPASPVSLDDAHNCAALYLADHSPDDPILDPLSADLRGLPPILIQDASGDARLADAKALAAHARARGVSVRLELLSRRRPRLSSLLVVSTRSR